MLSKHLLLPFDDAWQELCHATFTCQAGSLSIREDCAIVSAENVRDNRLADLEATQITAHMKIRTLSQAKHMVAEVCSEQQTASKMSSCVAACQKRG